MLIRTAGACEILSVLTCLVTTALLCCLVSQGWFCQSFFSQASESVGESGETKYVWILSIVVWLFVSNVNSSLICCCLVCNLCQLIMPLPVLIRIGCYNITIS